MSKAGRKGRYYDDVYSRFEDIEKMCKLGYSNNEIMECLGIKKTAFYNYIQKHKEFAELLKKSRQTPILELKSALYKRALGFKVSVNTYTVDAEGNETGTTKEQYFPPDATSILILLKHWDKNKDGSAKWFSDPASVELRKQELKLKEKQIELNDW